MRKRILIDKLCRRLDNLVERAEACGKHTKVRKTLMAQADGVREELRQIDH